MSGEVAAQSAVLPARAVALLAMAAFVSAATVRVTDPLVPAIAGEFATTAGAVGLTVTAFTLAYGICQLFWGPIGDRFGKYRVITLACLLSAGTAGAAALADSLPALAVLRLVGGVTAAAIVPLAMAFIGDHVPYEQRQATLARFIAGQILGLIGGQSIGGIVGDLLGWRAVFLVLAALFLLAGLLLRRELRAGTPSSFFCSWSESTWLPGSRLRSAGMPFRAIRPRCSCSKIGDVWFETNTVARSGCRHQTRR